jgi:hypothetical protein
VEDVREFIANLKGRSPQEVLGAVSESGLVQATVQATFGCLIVLVACTILPWAFKSDESVVAAETEPATTAAAEASENTTTDPQSETASTDAQSGNGSPSSSDAARAASAMKIDETVVTDPKSNPLNGLLITVVATLARAWIDPPSGDGSYRETRHLFLQRSLVSFVVDIVTLFESVV